MRKTIYFWMLAAAALAFNSCNKEAELGNSEEQITHVATISLGKAADTKTAVVEGEEEASYKWLDKDTLYLHVYENGTEGHIDSFVLNDDNTVATLTVSFTGNPTAPYTYTAKYAERLSGSKNPLILNEQNPGTESFDPAADVLVSKATDDVTNLNERATEFTFTMGRVVTVNKMTLTGLEEGEVVSTVEFTLDKDMWGYVSYSDKSNTYSYNNGGTKLTLKYTATNGVVPENGQFPVYFVSAPVDAAAVVSVVVTTDKNVYTKSSSLDPNPFDGKTITFAIGTMTRFNMGLNGYGEPIGEAVDYTLVEDNDYIAAGGKYIIVNQEGTKAMGAFNSSYFDLAAVKANNKVITIDAQQVQVITLEDAGDGYFYMKNADDEYLYWDSGNSIKKGVNDNSSGFKWSIEHEQIANAKPDGSDVRYLQYNNGNTRFACYKNTMAHVRLYVDLSTVTVAPALDEPTDVEAIVDADGILVTWTDITAPADETVTYNVTCTGQVAQVVSQGTGSATFEGLADGTYEVSVTAVPSTAAHKNSATVTLGDLVVDNTPDAPSYVKVTSDPTDWSGQYLIVYEANSVAFDGSLSDLDATPNTFSVTISNNKISSSPEVDAKSFTIAVMDNGYSIQASTGKYIGRSANSNGMDRSDNALLNTIAFVSHPIITSSGGKTLGFNSASNQLKFRYLGNSDIQLYKLDDKRQDPGMSWSPENVNASIEDGDIIQFTAPTLSNPNGVSGITYESTETSVATVSSEGTVTVLAAGTTTINAIFAGDADYKPQTVSYTLTVTDNRTPVVSYDFETVAELNALVTTTPDNYSGYLTDAVVSFAPADNTAIVTDGTGSVMFYKATNAGGHGLLQGQTFTGAITVTACIYKTTSSNVDYPLYSEVTAWDATFSGTGTIVNPESLSLADLAGNYSDYQNAYVSVAGLTVVSASTSNNKTTINVTDGINNYVVYDNTGSTTCGAGDTITAVGTVTKYKDTEQIKVWKSGDITITGTAPKAITFSQPTGAAATAGCSFKVKIDGSEITSGTTVALGKTVTLEATEGNDYTFEGWTVTGAEVNASALTTTFEMGSSAVTISASFTSTSGGDAIYSLYSGNITEGDYVIVYNGKAMNNTVSSNRLGYVEVTVSNNQIVNPAATIVWHIAASGSYWTLYNSAVAKYAASTGTKNQAGLNSSSTDNKSLWTVNGNSTYEFVNKNNSSNSVNANLRNNGTYGFACYSTSTGGALSLYKLN